MYPSSLTGRDRFILEHRGPRPPHDPWRYQDLVVEDERTEGGTIARIATVFLTGRECPWRCVMCDLWQYTTATDTPAGAIPAQISAARAALEPQDRPSQLKLYNASNFFDPRAVPDQDYASIAATLAGLDRVIVESHPSLIGPRVDRFIETLSRAGSVAHSPVLEVAMGLETVHPTALLGLHKRLTVEDFSAAAEGLMRRGVALRVFLLIAPPFVPADEQDEWLMRSIDVAVSCGATAVSLIPTRAGNGAMEALASEGAFRAPRLEDIERSVDAAESRRASTRIFVDLWNLRQFAQCPACFEVRRARLHTMNLEQRRLPLPACSACGSGRAA